MSLTRTENRNCPKTVGVPLRTPSLESRSPAGRAPPASVNVCAPTPPVAENLVEYDDPATAAGTVAVDMRSGSASYTVIENDDVLDPPLASLTVAVTEK